MSDVMGKGETQRRSPPWEKEPTAEKWTRSRDTEGLSLPQVNALSHWPQWLSWAHPLSFAYSGRGRVIRRNSPLGESGAGVWCVLILGLRSSEGPGELQGGKAKLYCR